MRDVGLLTFAAFLRAVRGRSITFAVLFAAFVFGWSITGSLRKLLIGMGVNWLYALLLPLIAALVFQSAEPKFVPDEQKRTWIARVIVLAAIVLGFLIAKVKHD